MPYVYHIYPMFSIRFFFRGVVFFLGWLASFSDDKMTGNTESIWRSLITELVGFQKSFWHIWKPATHVPFLEI